MEKANKAPQEIPTVVDKQEANEKAFALVDDSNFAIKLILNYNVLIKNICKGTPNELAQ